MTEDSNSQTAEEQAAFRAFLSGRDDIAEDLYLIAVEQMQSFGLEDVHLVECIHALARICISSGRLSEAESYFRRGLEVCERLIPAEEFIASLLMSQLGELYRWQGRHEQAEPLMVRSLELCERSMGADNQCLILPLGYYASLLEDTDREEDARGIRVRLDELSSRAPASGET
jgi:tetratricopeptide (TPR) repeat protein